eukprot:TRINITY_DN799_c0_g1_i2.p1 TRINITY_DN799_c0_g1~~TRINITY_DN799_c0_g1_i2.p1  ORF type:complete len:125 (+),score=10.30 TRINITY_DN799_c0_g1_i2:103-477(+)
MNDVKENSCVYGDYVDKMIDEKCYQTTKIWYDSSFKYVKNIKVVVGLKRRTFVKNSNESWIIRNTKTEIKRVKFPLKKTYMERERRRRTIIIKRAPLLIRQVANLKISNHHNNKEEINKDSKKE